MAEDQANGRVSISSLTPDPKNRRKRTTRNVAMIRDSLRAVGPARSIVIDESGGILAGSGTVQAAIEEGIQEVQVVEADRSALVAVRVSGLSEEDKRALAIYDNRSAELAEWNLEQLQADKAAGMDLERFFSEAEIGRLLADANGTKPETVLDQAVQMRPQREYVLVMCADGEAGAAEFERLKAALDLGLVRRGGYRHGSAFDAVGTQRVVKAADLLQRLKGSSNGADDHTSAV